MARLSRPLAASVAFFLAFPVPAARATTQPRQVRLVSPVGEGIAAVRSECPTFSWSLLAQAEAYRLVVYDASEGVAEPGRSSPVFEITLPAGAAVFTPTAERCLARGTRYGWAVAALVDGVGHWSEPALFQVLGEPLADSDRRSPRPATVDAPHPTRILAPFSPSFDAAVAGAAGPRQLHGDVFSPPDCTSMFADVPPSDAACPWIEQLARDQITLGCGGGNYCPDAPVTRRQVALLLERSMRGTDTFRPGSTTADIPNRPPAAATLTPLDTTGVVGTHTSITIGADGLGLISYRDFTNHDLKVAHCSNVDCSAATLTPVDVGGDAVFTSITIGADGLGLISYFDQDFDNLKVAHCSNVNCSAAATLTALDTTGNVGQYPSITIGADGLGLISYYDATNGDLKVAHCSNLNCSAAIFTPLDTTGDVGQYTSITIGADGLGLISYWDPINGDLKVAHCSNGNCTAATPNILDSTDNVGSDASITIGADGLGLISYYEATNGNLKVAHCVNVNCSAATLTPLDTPGDVGPYTSITIGADGLGLISYFDLTNFDLKVAHCSNAVCAPFFRRR